MGHFARFITLCARAKTSQKVMPHQTTLSMQISFMQIYANEVDIYALLHNIMSMQTDIYICIS